MLKKILFVFGALILLILGLAIALPVIFKDDIVKLVNEEASSALNAELELGDIGLSLIEDFPDFTLTLEQIKVSGRAPFEGVVLADIEAVKLSLDLMSVINGDKININTIGLLSPELHVIVLPDGRANYDIAPSSEETEVEPETMETSTSFNIGVKEYFIRNANIIYDDRPGGMYAHLVNFTHEGSGDFTQDDFLLKTKTSADALSCKMDGVAYLNQTELDMKFDIQMNLPNMRFVFDENYVRLNALELGFDGMVAMPSEEGDPIDMDLSFETKQTSFSSILSLIPGAYTADFKDVETEGQLALAGMAKGRMVGDQLPAFALDLTVKDARFQYPDLPAAAEQIAVDLHIKNPGGSDDLTMIDLNRFYVELAQNPLEMTLHMRTPISDPYIDAQVNTDIDLAILPTVMPLEEGQELTGRVFSNLRMKGNQSALDQERYSDFTAEGQVVMTGIDYKDPGLPYSTIIETCSLNFSPAFAELTAFKMKLDESDINLTGRVDNILGWYVGEEALSGTFNFSSSFMNLNTFMEEDAEAESSESETTEESTGVAEVPTGHDFVLNTSVSRMLYEDLEITNLNGQVILRDQKLDMRRLAMNLLEGSMTMSGYYETTNPVEPSFDFNMDIIGWDIPTTYAYLDMMQQMAPIMEDATGRFSTNVKMAGAMDLNMEPKYNTLDGGGTLITRNVVIDGPDILKKMADKVKYDGLEQITLNDTEVKYYFEDGRIKVDPATFIIGKEVPSIFAGSHGFDMTLDYVLNLDIPSRLMGGAANQVVSGLLAKANSAMGTNAAIPERIKMDVLIGGTSAEPVLTPMLAGTSGEGGAGADMKEQAKEALLDQKEALEDKAQEELDKAKAEADKAKKEAEAKARAEADAAKAKAKAEADAAKKRAEEEKRKAEEEARKKAEEAKRKAEEEAKKKARDLFK
jgi:hypothetical protein